MNPMSHGEGRDSIKTTPDMLRLAGLCACEGEDVDRRWGGGERNHERRRETLVCSGYLDAYRELRRSAIGGFATTSTSA